MLLADVNVLIYAHRKDSGRDHLVTTDADFGRFPGLRWQHPLRPRS